MWLYALPVPYLYDFVFRSGSRQLGGFRPVNGQIGDHSRLAAEMSVRCASSLRLLAVIMSGWGEFDPNILPARGFSARGLHRLSATLAAHCFV